MSDWCNWGKVGLRPVEADNYNDPGPHQKHNIITSIWLELDIIWFRWQAVLHFSLESNICSLYSYDNDTDTISLAKPMDWEK